MHSLKNTVVAVLLLGVSYGVYEAITAPVTDPVDPSLVAPLNIDDGMMTGNSNFADSTSQSPHINLPEVAVNPSNSTRLNGTNTTKPPVLKAVSPPTGDASVVNRTPNLSFAFNEKSQAKPASAELESVKSPVARDQKLIDALKDQINSDDELSGFDPKPKGEMVSVAMKPERAPTTQPANANKLSDFGSSAKSMTPENSNELSLLFQQVDEMARNGRVKEALEKLTPLFNAPELNSVQNQQLLGWLDGLASKVIYSSEHNLAGQPYVVQANESLVDLADRWKVTPQLIYNVNRSAIDNPSNIAAGTKLKQIRGPFHAEIDIKQKVMTLFVENLYAGRFPIAVGDQTTIEAGQYGVFRKAPQAPDANSETYMIMLDKGVCIRVATGNSSPSCIDLSAKDAADLFSIFTEQSNFFIKR